MILDFTFSNFRSFPEDTTLSMLATKTVSENKSVDEKNVFNCPTSEEEVLKVVAIYGANASGKSNIIKALQFFTTFILNSSKDGGFEDIIPVEPYLLDTSSYKMPTGFEMNFMVEGTKYRYGFEIYENKITSEWLYKIIKNRVKIFAREEQKIELGRSIIESTLVIPLTRPNALFLSVLGQFNNPIAISVIDWFDGMEFIAPELQRREIERASKEIIKDPLLKDIFDHVINGFDVGIENVLAKEESRYTEEELSSFSERVRSVYKNRTQIDIKTTHYIYDNEGKKAGETYFDLYSQESDGTRKLFALMLPIINALTKGTVVVIDEMDARLHPILTSTLLRLFSTSLTGKRCGQLIFTTHDTNLLDKNIFRRDQVWFVEKTSKGASKLKSLIQFQQRNDALYSKNYMTGRYGAVPYIDSEAIDSILHDNAQDSSNLEKEQ